MHISNNTAAIDVARLLHEVETKVDEALAAAGDLLAALPRARFEQALSAIVGQPVVISIAQLGTALGEARGHAVHAHRHLERVARENAIDVQAFGEERPKPDSYRFFTNAEDKLRVVA